MKTKPLITLVSLALATLPVAAITLVIGFPAVESRAETNPPDVSWLNQKEGPRPKYVWENREDTIYHEMWYPDTNKITAPEFWTIMREPWVFNRAMRWVEPGDGTIVALSEGGTLRLTGEHQASRWYSEPDNEVTPEGETIRFTKKTGRRRRDCAVLPSFQFHVGQHPVLRLSVVEASDERQLVASLKGRSGAPFISSGWQTGPKVMEFELRQKLQELGYTQNYAEIHFVVGLWAKDAASPGTVKFQAELVARPAAGGCLPVIRKAAAASGIPVSAIVTDADGRRLGKGAVAVHAVVNANRMPLKEREGVWRGALKRLGPGNYPVRIVAERTGSSDAPAASSLASGLDAITSAVVQVRVTDGDYYRYDKEHNYIVHRGRPAKPLTGSFQGTFFYRDVGLKPETLVKTQAEWDNWDRTEPPGEHLHYWESLTEPELEARFRYLAENGWDLVHLHSHYGIWERFDAFGHPAPHGVEQLATHIRAASKYGIGVMVALSSYPYSVSTTAWDAGTTPYAQTLEAGFKNEDWYEPANEPFGSQYRRYLKSFVGLFKDETGLFSWSSSGEGDWKNGPKRFLDSQPTIRSLDGEHLIVSEPILGLECLPAKQVRDYPSDLVGDRNYGLGGAIPFEQNMGILYRLNRMVPNMYLAEGSFPSSHLYTHMTGNGNPYVGTPEYRLHVRDTLHLGLVHRMPVIMTWDEVFTEDERRVLKEVRSRFDWRQPMEEPADGVIIGDEEAKGQAKLGPFEAVFTRLALDYRFITDRQEARPGEMIIDAQEAFNGKAFESVEALPEALRRRLVFRLSPGWSASHCTTRDRKSVLAYIYNTAGHAETSIYLGAHIQRRPEPRALALEFMNLPEGLPYTLYGLTSKRVELQGRISRSTGISLAATSHDYLLVAADSKP